MHELAMATLASGGRGGRLLVLVALLIVIVILAGGWILYAARIRAGRGQKP